MLEPLLGIVIWLGLLKIGRVSSEIIVPVAAAGEPPIYPVLLLTVRMTVSLAISAIVSAIGSTTTVAVVVPAAKVTVPSFVVGLKVTLAFVNTV